jgi:hypothetical protein
MQLTCSKAVGCTDYSLNIVDGILVFRNRKSVQPVKTHLVVEEGAPCQTRNEGCSRDTDEESNQQEASIVGDQASKTAGDGGGNQDSSH